MPLDLKIRLKASRLSSILITMGIYIALTEDFSASDIGSWTRWHLETPTTMEPKIFVLVNFWTEAGQDLFGLIRVIWWRNRVAILSIARGKITLGIVLCVLDCPAMQLKLILMMVL